jgi:endonuclease/exonuclease/phosphatase family metal-dependent hydrolase
MTSVSVLSYNVRSLRDDVGALTRVIRQLAPDVAIIQEAPRFLRWRSSCAALARRCGLIEVCGGRTAGANLVFSTLAVRVIATAEVSFSTQVNLHRRGAALALLELRGVRFAVAGTHLDLIEEPRLRHLEELRSALTDIAAGEPTIVGGDLNAVPGSATWLSMQRFGVDSFAAAADSASDHRGDATGHTYSATNPVRRIDALFADPRLRPIHAEVPDSPDIRRASDHRPLLVRYELP